MTNGFFSSRPTHHGSAQLVGSRQAGLRPVTRQRLMLPLGRDAWFRTMGTDLFPTGQHAVVLGPTRSGKSSLIYLPLILQSLELEPWDRPYLVIADPKHELLALTGDRLKAAGYHVRPVTLDDPTLATRWNPLASLMSTEGRLDHSGIWEVVDAMMPNGHEPDPYWNLNARLLLFASIVAVLYMSGDRANLTDALAWAFHPDRILRFLKERDPNVMFILSALLTNLEHNPTALGTILSELPGKLAPWMAPNLLALYQHPRWNFQSTIQQGTLEAIFLSGTPEHMPIMQLFWRQCLSALRKVQQEEGHLRRPTVLLLDELGNIGPIPHLAQAVTTLAGVGVSVIAGLQSLARKRKIDHTWLLKQPPSHPDGGGCFMG